MNFYEASLILKLVVQRTNQSNHSFPNRRTIILPLPAGEGWGEGESFGRKYTADFKESAASTLQRFNVSTLPRICPYKI